MNPGTPGLRVPRLSRAGWSYFLDCCQSQSDQWSRLSPNLTELWGRQIRENLPHYWIVRCYRRAAEVLLSEVRLNTEHPAAIRHQLIGEIVELLPLVQGVLPGPFGPDSVCPDRVSAAVGLCPEGVFWTT